MDPSPPLLELDDELEELDELELEELEELELEEELDELLLELLELDDELLELEELELLEPPDELAPPQPVSIRASDKAKAPLRLPMRRSRIVMRMPFRIVCPGSDPAWVVVIVRADGSNVAQENRLIQGEM